MTATQKPSPNHRPVERRRRQQVGPYRAAIYKFRLFVAVAVAPTYLLFSRNSPRYGHLLIAVGLAIMVWVHWQKEKKAGSNNLLTFLGGALMNMGIIIMTGFYTSPFLFLLIFPAFTYALTAGPRWAWFTFFAYSPFLAAALTLAVRHQDWNWASYSAAIWVLLFASSSVVYQWETQSNFLKTKANRDQLTGLANRYALENIANNFGQYLGKQLYTLAMLDLDGFKQYNDFHGHLAGDEMLKKVAQVLRHNIRDDDLILRYGGDEFLVIFRGTTREEAAKVIDRATEKVWLEAKCRISAGLADAVISKYAEFMDLLYQADQALYINKRERKNQPPLP